MKKSKQAKNSSFKILMGLFFCLFQFAEGKSSKTAKIEFNITNFKGVLKEFDKMTLAKSAAASECALEAVGTSDPKLIYFKKHQI